MIRGRPIAANIAKLPELFRGRLDGNFETVRSGLRGTNWRGTPPLGLAFCLVGNQEASDGSGSH